MEITTRDGQRKSAVANAASCSNADFEAMQWPAGDAITLGLVPCPTWSTDRDGNPHGRTCSARATAASILSGRTVLNACFNLRRAELTAADKCNVCALCRSVRHVECP